MRPPELKGGGAYHPGKWRCSEERNQIPGAEISGAIVYLTSRVGLTRGHRISLNAGGFMGTNAILAAIDEEIVYGACAAHKLTVFGTPRALLTATAYR